MRHGIATFLLAAALAAPANAEAPAVVTDIQPVHWLVTRVMQGVAAPSLVVPANVDQHNYDMRPSAAAALENADVVIWMGEELTPWLAGSVETLAADARVISLLEVEGTRVLPFREDAEMHNDHEDDHGDDHDEAHADDHDEAHADDHDEAHADDHDEAHADDHDEAHEADHVDAHTDDHGHMHAGGNDPHAWLDPLNAATWVGVIAEALSENDPANAKIYRANAESARSEIAEALSAAEALLTNPREIRYVVFHDAYQYFENRFGLTSLGAVTLSDAIEPGPARIAELQGRLRESGSICFLVEPQARQSLVETVGAGAEMKIVTIDPLGAKISSETGRYSDLILSLAESFAACR